MAKGALTAIRKPKLLAPPDNPVYKRTVLILSKATLPPNKPDNKTTISGINNQFKLRSNPNFSTQKPPAEISVTMTIENTMLFTKLTDGAIDHADVEIHQNK